jgi:HAMP domain-containing protein
VALASLHRTTSRRLSCASGGARSFPSRLAASSEPCAEEGCRRCATARLRGLQAMYALPSDWTGSAARSPTPSTRSCRRPVNGHRRPACGRSRAVAKGDLSQTMRLEVDGRPLEGEFLRSATIVNTMIEQLSVFTSEVTRVAREVGTEGKLGGQAAGEGRQRVWKDLTDNVNSMASNLTAQVRNIADVTIAVASGDLSRKITVDVRGEILAAQGHHQHDGRPAALVRVRGDARGARGRHRGQARRAGRGAGRRRAPGRTSPTR